MFQEPNFVDLEKVNELILHQHCEVAIIDKYDSRAQFCWPRESQWAKIGSTMSNGMMELIDMSSRSTICRICRLGPSNSNKIGGGFRGPFCDPTVGMLKIWFGELFVWRWPTQDKNSPTTSPQIKIFWPRRHLPALIATELSTLEEFSRNLTCYLDSAFLPGVIKRNGISDQKLRFPVTEIE